MKNITQWREELQSLSDEELKTELKIVERNVETLRFESTYYEHVGSLLIAEQERRAGLK